MNGFLFEVSEAPQKKRKIEDDLLIRYKKLQSKIEALKLRQQNEELKNNQSIPTINSASRKLAKNSEKSLILPLNHLEKAYELLINSRFFPKHAKISLKTLNNSPPHPLETQKLDFFLPKCLNDSFLHFPSLRSVMSLNQRSIQELSPEIMNRNKLLRDLREEVISRGFVHEPDEPPTQQSIHERSQIWLYKRQKRIKELKDDFDVKDLVECTFNPIVLKKASRSVRNVPRSSSVENSYVRLYEKRKELRNGVKGGSRLDTLCGMNDRNSSRFSERFWNNRGYCSLSPVIMSVGYEKGYREDSENRFRNRIE